MTRQRLALAAALPLVAAVLAADVGLPPPPVRYFNDYAGLVAPDVALRLDDRLRAFEAQSSNQVVVAIFRELPWPPMETFTLRTAGSWRVGRKGLDSGAILFVFVKDRKLRLEVGYGLEGALPDATARRILDEAIAPRFRVGDPAGGLEAGIDAVLAATRGEYAAKPAERRPGRTTVPPAAAPLPASLTRLVVGVVAVVTALVFGLYGVVYAFANVAKRFRLGDRWDALWSRVPDRVQIAGTFGTILAVFALLNVAQHPEKGWLVASGEVLLVMAVMGGFLGLFIGLASLLSKVFPSWSRSGGSGGTWDRDHWHRSGSSTHSSFSSGRSSSSGGGFSGGGGRFGGGGASGGW